MNRLKELRKANKLSISELSRETGIIRSTLSYIESGKRRMNVEHAKILAPYFGVSIDYILGGDAVTYARDINEALETLFAEMFDEFISATDQGTLDERSRLIYSLIDRILHSNVTTTDLKTVISMLDVLIRSHDKEAKQEEE